MERRSLLSLWRATIPFVGNAVLFLFCTPSLATETTFPARDAIQNQVFEIELSGTKNYDRPDLSGYMDPLKYESFRVFAKLEHCSGTNLPSCNWTPISWADGSSKKFFGFWDGNKTWKVRMTLPRVGFYRYTVTESITEARRMRCSSSERCAPVVFDEGLSGSGVVRVTGSTAASELARFGAPIKLAPYVVNGVRQREKGLTYADGTPYFMVAENWTRFGDNSESTVPAQYQQQYPNDAELRDENGEPSKLIDVIMNKRSGFNAFRATMLQQKVNYNVGGRVLKINAMDLTRSDEGISPDVRNAQLQYWRELDQKIEKVNDRGFVVWLGWGIDHMIDACHLPSKYEPEKAKSNKQGYCRTTRSGLEKYYCEIVCPNYFPASNDDEVQIQANFRTHFMRMFYYTLARYQGSAVNFTITQEYSNSEKNGLRLDTLLDKRLNLVKATSEMLKRFDPEQRAIALHLGVPRQLGFENPAKNWPTIDLFWSQEGHRENPSKLQPAYFAPYFLPKVELRKPFCSMEVNWAGFVLPKNFPRLYQRGEFWPQHEQIIGADDQVWDTLASAESSLLTFLSGSSCLSHGAAGVYLSSINPENNFGYPSGNIWGPSASVWDGLLGKFSSNGHYQMDFQQTPKIISAFASELKTVAGPSWYRIKPMDNSLLNEAALSSDTSLSIVPQNSAYPAEEIYSYTGAEEGYRIVYPNGRPFSFRFLNIPGEDKHTKEFAPYHGQGDLDFKVNKASTLYQVSSVTEAQAINRELRSSAAKVIRLPLRELCTAGKTCAISIDEIIKKDAERFELKVELPNAPYSVSAYIETPDSAGGYARRKIWALPLMSLPPAHPSRPQRNFSLFIPNPKVKVEGVAGVKSVMRQPGVDPELFDSEEDTYRLMYTAEQSPGLFKVAKAGSRYRIRSFVNGSLIKTMTVTSTIPRSAGEIPSIDLGHHGLCQTGEPCVVHVTQDQRVVLEVKRANVLFAGLKSAAEEVYVVTLPSGTRKRDTQGMPVKVPFAVGSPDTPYSISKLYGHYDGIGAISSDSAGNILLTPSMDDKDFVYLFIKRTGRPRLPSAPR